MANVGYLINFEGHHKHSYHLILNSELPGFEREQLQLLANVARYHRGTRPKQKHDEYPRAVGGRSAPRGRAGRHPAAGPGARSHASAARARSAGPRRPTTACESRSDRHGDADVDLWAAERKVELFEKVFGREVQFSATTDEPPRRTGRGRARSVSNRLRPR